MSACIFCRILAGELDSACVAENLQAIAFLDISPVNPGHTLVIPRRHVSSFTELTAEESAVVFSLAQQMARQLKAALPEYAGVTLSLADGEAAGQEVAHAHFHVIPRKPGDGFGWRRLGARTDKQALRDLAGLIQRAGEDESA